MPYYGGHAILVESGLWPILSKMTYMDHLTLTGRCTLKGIVQDWVKFADNFFTLKLIHQQYNAIESRRTIFELIV